MPSSDLISNAEASRMLCVSRRSIQNYAVRGWLPYVDTALGRLFRPEDVEAVRPRVNRATQWGKTKPAD